MSSSRFYSGKKGTREEKTVTEISQTVTSAKSEGCMLTLNLENKEQATHSFGVVTTTDFRTYRIPLGRMSGASLKQVVRSEYQPPANTKWGFEPDHVSSIELDSLDKVVSFTYRQTSTMEGIAPYSDSGIVDFFRLQTDDAEMAERVTKALEHAITLCKAPKKPEPF